MSLLSDIEAARRPGGTRCAVSVLIEALSPDDVAALRTAIAGDAETYPGSAIARALRAKGHHINQQSINRHRSGECKCP